MVIPFSIKLNFLQDVTALKLQRIKGYSESGWNLSATRRSVTHKAGRPMEATTRYGDAARH